MHDFQPVTSSLVNYPMEWIPNTEKKVLCIGLFRIVNNCQGIKIQLRLMKYMHKNTAHLNFSSLK